MTLMACYGGGWDEGPGTLDEEPGVCGVGTSGVDNDGDGYCSDADCDDHDALRYDLCPDPGCVDSDADGWCANEDCNDNDAGIGADCACIDIDGDGFCSTEDCDDRDASSWNDCDNICDVASAIEDPGAPITGSTLGADDVVGTSCGGTSDVVFSMVVEGDPGVLQYVTADVTAEGKHYLAARAACESASDIACGLEAPHIEVIAVPGDTLWLVVEAATPEDRGDFSLAIEVQPIVCGDGAQVGTEACDDGNQDPGDGCDANCEIEEGEAP